MSRSLSWIEKSALDKRLSELTRPVGYPVPEPASERPAPAEANPDHAGRTRRRAEVRESDLAEAEPPLQVPAPPRRPPPAKPTTQTKPVDPTRPDPQPSVGPATSGVPLVPANQDPWTMTPAQPWSTLVNPSNDRATPGIPELSYPRVMALAARLELFRDWIRQYCGEGAFFVADTEGLPLLLDRVRTSQAVTAVALERALRPLRGLLGSSKANSLCIELEDGRLVQTIWAMTPAGRIAVGMAPPRPLGPAATAQVRRALLGLFTDEETQ